jgi:hypothetical protein
VAARRRISPYLADYNCVSAHQSQLKPNSTARVFQSGINLFRLSHCCCLQKATRGHRVKNHKLRASSPTFKRRVLNFLLSQIISGEVHPPDGMKGPARAQNHQSNKRKLHPSFVLAARGESVVSNGNNGAECLHYKLLAKKK